VKVYRVGGSVRDELLGLGVKDHDHVVVGATVEEMERLGYQPVGKDFPVFLHPQTHEEYALARTERKTGRGYKGFTVFAAPEVTLEEDLARRDLTINAIARDEQGTLIDPFDGAGDIRRGVLRHVGPAFVEDPVRILRVARFAARFGFAVASETFDLMRAMVAHGEVDHLVPERVWQELAKGLMEPQPSRMFEVLSACGALAHVLPEVDRLLQEDPAACLGALDRAAARDRPLEVRYAVLFLDGTEPRSITQLARAASERVRAPNECRDLAVLAADLYPAICRALELDAVATVDLLQRSDAFRRPERFARLLEACAAGASETGRELGDFPQAVRLLAALDAAGSVDAASIAAGSDPGQIAERIRAARVEAVKAASGQPPARPSR
jgi:tRNA nucleotidyltransferase (CCA-adding enzyme)